VKLSPMVAPALRHRPSFFSTERDAQGATSMTFGFDGVYEEPENTALYRQHVKKVMQSAMDGINGTVFAYGQVRIYATRWYLPPDSGVESGIELCSLGLTEPAKLCVCFYRAYRRVAERRTPSWALARTRAW
jgi:hypothetical protein